MLHVGGYLAAEVLVDIELREVLAEHEAVAAEAGEETHLGVDHVARLGVASRPDGQETHLAQVGNPFGEDLGDNLEELLAVVLDVLACLVGIGVGAGAADNLACVAELLAIDGTEALVVATVDNHVERALLASRHLTHHRETTGDEGLVLDGVEADVEVELVDELLGTPTHGVDEVVAGVLDVCPFMVADKGEVLVAVAPDMQQLAVLVVAAAVLHADAADVVDDAARGGLPAVAGDEGVAVSVLAVVPEG